MSSDRPCVVTDPAVRRGQPNVKGASVEAVAELLLAEQDLAVAADDYGLTRADVLVACLWDTRTVDYDAIPDPPLGGAR